MASGELRLHWAGPSGTAIELHIQKVDRPLTSYELRRFADVVGLIEDWRDDLIDEQAS